MHEDGHAPPNSQPFPHVSRDSVPSRIDESGRNLVSMCSLDATVPRRIDSGHPRYMGSCHEVCVQRDEA